MSSNPTKTRIEPRYEMLDYIRGWGAMTVVIIHVFVLMVHIKSYPEWAFIEWLPSRMFFIGSAALIVFFTLSGFALFLLFETAGKNYLKFVISRWFRIFPVYFASILLAIGLFFSYKATNHLLPDHIVKLDATNFIQHILLIGPLDLAAYNGPIWSLVHEMRLSLLFPLLYFAVQKSTLWAAIITTSISLTLGITSLEIFYSAQYLQLTNLQHTMHYTTMFTYGAIVAKNRHAVIDYIQRMPPKLMIGLLCLVLFLIVYVPPLFNDSMGRTMLEDIVTGGLSAALIALVISIKNPPRIPTLEFLGKISFSLYVIHVPVIFCLRNYLTDVIPFPLLFVLYILGPILAASILFSTLEKRSLRWSRKARQLERAQPQLIPEK